MRRAFVAVLLLVSAISLEARVTSIEITRRADILGGKAFGAVGAYEKIVGKLHFAVKPDNPYNKPIVDLDLAPRNANGEVEFTADVYILKPKDTARGNGSLVVEIPNRGGKGILGIVNRGTGSLDPQKESDFGDGFLMNHGFTVAWIGWQWDARRGDNRMALDAPIATDHGKTISGLVRSDYTPTEVMKDLPLGHLITGTIGGTEYEAAEPQNRKNVLTVRDEPTGARTVIPRSQWSFSADRKSVHYEAGFQPGRIYELVYVAHDPHIAGLGFAAVRDFVSWLKNSPDAVAPVKVAHGVGISQCGRFLRHMLYEGFNADEEGRQVFDGMIPHVAGAGRGNFNYRFAQPSRDAQPMSSIFYATDLYPFTDLPQRDPVTGRNEGLLDRTFAEHVAPKIFYTNTSYEYWGRAASLISTTPDGLHDAPIPDNVRIYLYAGLQHFSGPFPPTRNIGRELEPVNPTSPLAVAWFWRNMLVRLDDWVKNGTLPPPSRYPRIDDGTLVPREKLAFPAIAGVKPPSEVSEAWRIDFGAEWPRAVTKQPPVVGQAFPVLVPQVDADGNDLAGIHLPELVAPVATYTGWNFRDPSTGAPWARVSFLGSYFPFAQTRDEREKRGDPRPSLAERYRTPDDYLGRFTRAALGLAHDHYILFDDIPPIIQRGIEEWDYATK